jgi:hypothetical protein
MNFKGQDHHAKILIDLADAYNGAKRTIALHMPTLDAGGHVTTQERKLDVSIPKGIKAGQNLKILWARWSRRWTRTCRRSLILKLIFIQTQHIALMEKMYLSTFPLHPGKQHWELR